MKKYVWMDGKIVCIAVLVVCSVGEHDQRDILTVAPIGGARGHLPVAISWLTRA